MIPSFYSYFLKSIYLFHLYVQLRLVLLARCVASLVQGWDTLPRTLCQNREGSFSWSADSCLQVLLGWIWLRASSSVIFVIWGHNCCLLCLCCFLLVSLSNSDFVVCFAFLSHLDFAKFVLSVLAIFCAWIGWCAFLFWFLVGFAIGHFQLYLCWARC